MHDDKREGAIFAIRLFRLTESALIGMGSSMVWTDSQSFAVTPWNYDDENDPDGLLADLDETGRWNPEENFEVDACRDLVERAILDTDIIERKDPDMLALAQGLASGALGIPADQAWKPCDRQMRDFAAKNTEGLDLYYNVDEMQGGAFFRVKQPHAPRNAQLSIKNC